MAKKIPKNHKNLFFKNFLNFFFSKLGKFTPPKKKKKKKKKKRKKKHYPELCFQANE